MFGWRRSTTTPSQTYIGLRFKWNRDFINASTIVVYLRLQLSSTSIIDQTSFGSSEPQHGEWSIAPRNSWRYRDWCELGHQAGPNTPITKCARETFHSECFTNRSAQSQSIPFQADYASHRYTTLGQALTALSTLRESEISVPCGK